MNKIMGILTPFFISFGMIIVAIVTGLIVETTSNGGWAALGAILMVFFATGIILFVFLIVSIVFYSKKKTDYWLGSLYGYALLVGTSVVLSVVVSVYNALV